MPGISFSSGIITYLMAGPALRGALVSGELPGDTAYTAMPEGSLRDSAATHQAMMSFESINGRTESHITIKRGAYAPSDQGPMP